MTLFYPDISNFQGNISLKGEAAVAILATQGTGFTNSFFGAQLSHAASADAFAFGYHFLMEGNGAAQAKHYHAVAGGRPCMIDTEVYAPPGGAVSRPTLTDVIAFATALRGLGGVTHLAYLPEWYWDQIGKPSLHVLRQAGLSLVSSDYPTNGYTALGPGWDPYGGATPSVWQYTNAHAVNGVRCDYNAFKGTLAQFKDLVSGAAAPTVPHKQQEDPDMNIAADEATKTLSWISGTAKGFVLTCDSPNPQHFEVLLSAKDRHRYKTVTLTVSQGRETIEFPDKTTYMVFVKRTDAQATWAQTWAHTY